MDLGLGDKRAIITGGSRGLGRAVAANLLAEGARVALVARDRAGLDAAEQLLDGGDRVLGVVADTADDESVTAMVSQVVDRFGGVDILVNGAARAAGGTTPPGLSKLTDDGVRAEFEVKVLGYLRCARAVAPHMIEQGWGRIINISGLNARSATSIVGSMRNVSVSAMTKNLADELGSSGINVTVVHPGVTVTEGLAPRLQPQADAQGTTVEALMEQLAKGVSIGRLVTGEEIADVITFLASPRSVAINGDAVAVGGGSRGPIYY
jgi:NAD(P)-dependent dehydrogenase (short-subunit alcohol dehydrogenase family)